MTNPPALQSMPFSRPSFSSLRWSATGTVLASSTDCIRYEIPGGGGASTEEEDPPAGEEEEEEEEEAGCCELSLPSPPSDASPWCWS